MLEKRAWAMKRLDHLRKALILEPRGHTDMYGALLTEPVTRDAHAGVLFMHNEGWSTMCGHGIIAVTTMAIERGLIWLAAPEPRRRRVEPEDGRRRKPTSVEIRYDTPAGPGAGARAPRASRRRGSRRVRRVPQRRVVRVRALADGPGRRPQDSGRRRVRRRVLRHRRCRSRRRADRCRASARAAQARHDDRARGREAAPRRPSERRRASRGSTARSSPRRRSCPTRTCATSRSSPMPKSIARRAAPEPPR